MNPKHATNWLLKKIRSELVYVGMKQGNLSDGHFATVVGEDWLYIKYLQLAQAVTCYSVISLSCPQEEAEIDRQWLWSRIFTASFLV